MHITSGCRKETCSTVLQGRNGLDESNEESSEYKSCIALYGNHAGGYHAPDSHSSADINAWVLCFPNNDIRRNLH